MDAYDYLKPYLPNWHPTRENVDWVGGLCPFHEERHPSFYVHRASGGGFCHSEHKWWSLEEILRHLRVRKKEANEIVEMVGATAKRRPRRQADPTVLPERILGLFRGDPTPHLPGFSPAILREEEVGFDPKELRVTFPIRSPTGELIAISGRATEEGQWPRYKFYGGNEQVPDCIREFAPNYQLLPHNSFWGGHKAFFKAQEVNFLTIVEGFKARLRLLEDGWSNTVAALGSHLGESQRLLLAQLGLPLCLFFDNDEAGIDGTIKAAKALVALVPHVAICRYDILGTGEQPDDLTSQQVAWAIEQALPFGKWRRAMGLRERRVQSRQRKTERAELYEQGQTLWEKGFDRQRDQLLISSGDRPISIHPIELDLPNPQDTSGPNIQTFSVDMHEDRAYWMLPKMDRRKRAPIFPTTVCTAGYQGEVQPCNGCKTVEAFGADTTITNRRHMEAVQVVVLEWYHYEERERRRGGTYTKVSLCRRRRCPECAKGIPKTFGRRMYMLLSPNHFDAFLGADADAQTHCLHCGQDVWTTAILCARCGADLYVLSEDLTDIEVEELLTRETRCEECNHVGQPVEGLACEGNCSAPKRASIFDTTITVKKSGTGTATALQFSDLKIEDLANEVLEFAKPLDFERLFEPNTLEEQAQILQCKNYF